MKNDNKKVVKTMSVLNAFVIAGLVVSILVLVVFCMALFDSSVADSAISHFVEPMFYVVVFGCPLLLIPAAFLVYYAITLLNKKVFDKEFTKANLRFEIIIFTIYLLVVSGFYFMPSVLSWREHSYMDTYDNSSNICTMSDHMKGGISSCKVY